MVNLEISVAFILRFSNGVFEDYLVKILKSRTTFSKVTDILNCQKTFSKGTDILKSPLYSPFTW